MSKPLDAETLAEIIERGTSPKHGVSRGYDGIVNELRAHAERAEEQSNAERASALLPPVNRRCAYHYCACHAKPAPQAEPRAEGGVTARRRWDDRPILNWRASLGRLGVKLSWHRANSFMGRFGGGWQWKIGAQCGGGTILFSLLIVELTLSWKPRIA